MTGDPERAPGSGQGDYERLRRRVLWSMPSGLYVLGSRSGERLNAMTLSWAMQASIDPKVVAVGVARSAYTHELITEGRVFSLMILARQDRTLVRKFVKPVKADLGASTLNGFHFGTAETGAPILDLAQAHLDCRVIRSVDVGDHSVFFGEVVGAAFSGDESVPTLRMEDTRMNYGG